MKLYSSVSEECSECNRYKYGKCKGLLDFYKTECEKFCKKKRRKKK